MPQKKSHTKTPKEHKSSPKNGETTFKKDSGELKNKKTDKTGINKSGIDPVKFIDEEIQDNASESNHESDIEKIDEVDKVQNEADEADEDENEDDDIKDDILVEEMLENEMHVELNEEDDEEFIQNVKEFEKSRSKAKVINIFNRIGKPKFTEAGKLDNNCIKDELKKLILLLDKFDIIVHFHNDYSDREKYRFITEEIFKEFAEYDRKNHITFLYEDYHPEMADDDDDEY